MPYLDHVVDATSLRVKRSDQPGEVPSAGSLRPGELAINIADNRLYIGGLGAR